MSYGVWDVGHNQFEFANWYEKDLTYFKTVKVEVVSENERRFSSVIQNIVTSADSTVLKTSFSYNYAPRQKLFYRGKWWELAAVGEITQDINPQALGYTVPQAIMQYVLEIKEVDVV